MIYVLNDGSGRLCNKLLFAANILASCIENGNKITYYNYPFSWVKKKENQYIVPKRYINKYINIILDIFLRKITKKKLFGYQIIYKQDVFQTNAILAGQTRNVIWCGWPYFDLVNLKKYRTEITKYFCFPEYVDRDIKEFFKQISIYDVVIGVHLRRDDYKEWREGRYYYEDEVYLHYMQECCRLFGNNIGFVLFSDESWDSKVFANFNILKSEGTVLGDLCSMAKCDFLIGPPSTFSGWASFYGNVPRYIIEERGKNLSKEDFKIWLIESDEWTVTE